jgi:hypothetical protein
VSLAALARSAEVQVLGFVLLHFLWQGVLIAGALWLLLAGLPRARAEARYTACCAALGALLLAPLLTLALLWRPQPELLRGTGLELPRRAGCFWRCCCSGRWAAR